MPSLRQIVQDYALPVGSQVAGGLIARRGVSNATNNLTNGVRRASDAITAGSDRAAGTMATTYAGQQRTLAPYRAAGESTLPGLTAGVAPGGEFNKPFTMADFDLYKDPGFNFRIQQGERAIKAGANAGGIRFSGATLKALSQFNQDSASQEAGAAYARQQNDLSGRFGRVMDVEGIGERAAGAEVNAGSQYGANLSRLQQSTATQLADLETDLASAQAAGDIAGANAINDTISGILSSVDGAQTAKAIGSTARPMSQLAPEVGRIAGLAGPAATGILATNAGAGLSTAAPFYSSLAAGAADVAGLTGAGTAAGATAATTGAGATGVTGALGLGGGSGLLGLGAATIPVIGAVVAGAVIGAGLWKKAQTSAKADTWVQGVQNPFDGQMDAIGKAEAAGQIPPAEAAQSRKAVVTDYLAAAMEFSTKGKDHATVIRQALDTFKKYYPSFAGSVA